MLKTLTSERSSEINSKRWPLGRVHARRVPRVRWVKAADGNEEAELEQGPRSLKGHGEETDSRGARGSRTQGGVGGRDAGRGAGESCLKR